RFVSPPPNQKAPLAVPISGRTGLPARPSECDEGGPPRWQAPSLSTEATERRPVAMLHVGLDLSRRRLDFHLLDGEGCTVDAGATVPDAEGLARFAGRVRGYGEPVRA